MKFTIAIISYNAEAYIKRCIESCTNQTYKNLEILVVDDNSNDKTVEIVKSLQAVDTRIKLIQHPENRSALQSRKTAIEKSSSKYTWFIDSDDCIDDLGAVGIIARKLKEQSYPDMLQFGSKDYFENGELKRVFYDWGRNRSLSDWKFDSDFRPYTRITKTSVLREAAKVIPDDLYLYRHNDLFMFCLVKLCTQTRAFLEKPLYRYTLSSTSVTNQKDINSISRHAELISTLLVEYRKSAINVKQNDINVDEFIDKEHKKLIKYALGQYSSDAELYLHSLKSFYGKSADVIVSLTTYSSRINTVHIVIESLLKQNVAVDKIVLWLDENEFNFHNLPKKLTKLLSKKFEIKFCPNYKSYKKLIPSLKEFPSSTIITVDDDIDYPSDQVEKLLLKHYSNPECIITNVARNILTEGGKVSPYSDWHHVFKEQVDKPFINLIPIGVGGVLYPANSLHEDVINEKLFMKLAPHGDDLWFKAMSLLNNRKVICTGESYKLKPRQIDGTADVGLWQQVNKGTDSNVEQFNAITSNYPKLAECLSTDEFNQLSLSKSELVKFYGRVKPIRMKKDSSLGANDAISLLKAIEELSLKEVKGNRNLGVNHNSDSSKINKARIDEGEFNSYSLFKLANRLFIEKRYYESASIYKYLDSSNPKFKHYGKNFKLAKERFERKQNMKLKVRWDSNIAKGQYDISALDIIYNADEGSKNFVLKKLSELNDVTDSLLLHANIVRANRAKWVKNLNTWLSNFGLSSLEVIGDSDTILSTLKPKDIKRFEKPDLVTVFMSAFNSEDTISYAISSILDQSYENIELIIIDDKSTDQTPRLIEKFAKQDRRIKFQINSKNKGTYANRNVGLELARGKYFTVMDADDYALPERIEKQVENLKNKATKNIGVLGHWVRVNSEGLFGCRHTWTASYMQPAVATLMFERELVVEKIGFFDEVRFGADTEYYERMKKAFGQKSVVEIEVPLCLSAWQESSLTGCPRTGIDFILGTSPIRLKYNESWKQWHSNGQALFLKKNSSKQDRKFYAPNEML